MNHPSEVHVHRPVRRLCAGIVVVASLGFLSGLLADARAAWTGWLMAFACFAGLSLAGPLFLAIQNLAGARWAEPLRPIAVALSRTLPVAAALGIGLSFGAHALYEWADASAVDATPALARKTAWLNVPFFAIRTALFFAIWIWFARRLSALASQAGPVSDRGPALRLSAGFLAVFAVTFSLATVDWFQSLDPEWYSTMYALMMVSGVATSGLAIVMIGAVVLRRAGVGRVRISEDALDDLGKCALALSLLWVYLAFCQYLLIWYTNIPEETAWYEARHHGAWKMLSLVSIGANWLIPFVVLMPRPARRSEGILVRVAVAMLVGRVIDLYTLLAPVCSPSGPNANPFLWLPLLGGLAGSAWMLTARIGAASAAKTGDGAVKVPAAH